GAAIPRCVSLIMTPGSAAPVSSRTTPSMTPVVICDCAPRGIASQRIAVISRQGLMISYLPWIGSLWAHSNPLFLSVKNVPNTYLKIFETVLLGRTLAPPGGARRSHGCQPDATCTATLTLKIAR